MSDEAKNKLMNGRLIGRGHDMGASGKPPKAILVMPAGERTVASYRPDGNHVEMKSNGTAASARKMEAARRQLVAKGTPPFFDYAHHELFHTGDDRKSGVPTRFWHDPKRGVMADVQWTDAAKNALTGTPPEYEAFSPHIPIDEKGEALGLYENCGGILNRGTFGSVAKFSESADLQEMVAADPRIVEQVSAAPGDDETNAAEKEEVRMKQLIAKLCAVFKLDPEKATEPELIAAFDQSQGSVATLTGRATLGEQAIVALGFEKTAAPTTAELTAKVTSLSTPGEAVIGKRLVGFAVKVGIIAPAEEADWNGKMDRDAAGWTQELAKKTPSVLVGKVVDKQETGASAANVGDPKATLQKFNARVDELIAKDPSIAPIAAKGDLAKARSLAAERIAREEPALMQQ